MAYYFDPARRMSVYVPQSVVPGTTTSGGYPVYNQPYGNTPGTRPTAPLAPSGEQPSSGGAEAASRPTNWSGWGVDFGANENAYREAQQRHSEALAQIDAAVGRLEGLIPNFQQSAAEQEAQIGRSRETQLASSKASFQAQQQNLENTQTQQQQLTETAANESRRQAAEVLQGIQARYGSTTGEGTFASALTGAQTSRNIAQINQQFANFSNQISQKIGQVQDISRIAGQQIEDNASQQITAAKQWLNGALTQIRSNQATLQSHKADLAFAALSQYQQYLEQLNLNKQNLLAQLAALSQGSTNQLQGYLQQAYATSTSPQVSPFESNTGVSAVNEPSAFSGIGGAPGTVPTTILQNMLGLTRPEDYLRQIA